MSNNWMFHSHEFEYNKSLCSFGLKDPLERRNKKMVTLREKAKDYKSPETKNICELEEVSTEIDTKTKVVNEGQENEFSYEYIIVEDEEYRVPNSVIKQLQTLLKQKPDATKFKAIKEGEGMKTTYQVMLLD